MRKHISIFTTLSLMLISASLLKYGFANLLNDDYPTSVRILTALFILIFGAIYPLTKSAEVIEGATDVLSKKTGLAAGLLQSLGTAFPDMILGVTAAIISLSYVIDDPSRAISFAMIAAATTFGSNIYNIGHSIWCIYRQNLADRLNSPVLMFPGIIKGGQLIPLKKHKRLPTIKEINVGVNLLTILTLLTSGIALLMVAFGQVGPNLYQLIRPAGILLLLITVYVLFKFRTSNNTHPETLLAETNTPLVKLSLPLVWVSLLIAGVTIAFSAETMIKALEIISVITGIPYVISGTLAGLIGCLGEMIVIHNYSIHQNGRLGDAVIGVAMDNIVTIMGASIVAIMGGIFLGGTSLIVLFILILTLNTLLIKELSILKSTIHTLRK